MDAMKRYQFFAYYADNDSPEGGLDDIAGQGDTLAEGLILFQDTDLTCWGRLFYWLDMDERRRSTADEEAEFLRQHQLLYLQRHPPEPPAPPLTKQERDEQFLAIAKALTSFDSFGPLSWFNSGIKEDEDPLTPEEQRKLYLKSCRVL